ncbi:FAD-dependent oxidoreductase [Streptomyces sp. NBC_01239]|uniref:FAD-dependent oxidoreductase n=1 Tax=Streptomyces sp. NBC_01239 TaxID=2903792 RepID=UPI0022534A5D|nr:FAD-dependent oxidoreductase [Streptomyces sp. NBC_01239]MCX4815228.1 FAD-dependent oxidoreductase [Streptomyces sp. NBC_01239]
MGSGETYDIVVVGSGGGGLVGAYVAASRGLRTLVIEKTGRVGGTTAYSGAGLWFPGSAPLRRAGVEDSIENARTYLRDVVADESREHLQDAYLDAGRALIDELEQNSWFQSFVYGGPVPDYFDSAPGASPAGRTIFPPNIAIADLGEHAGLVRDSLPVERLGARRGEVFDGGRALIGRALAAFLETGNGTLLLDTRLEELVVEDGRVTGVTASSAGERTTFRAGRGVLLAAGGFERDAELRQKHHPVPLDGTWSNGAPGNTGDALRAGVAVGADTDLLDEAWYVPGLVQPDGLPLFHTGTRGGIWVNAAGERFVNETRPYDQAGHELVRLHRSTGVAHIPCHWVFDQRHLDRDSFGGDPGLPPDPAWFESGALRKADSLEELAKLIEVPYDTLRKTVEEYNGYSGTGVDARFHRGESPWDKSYLHMVGFPAGPVMNYPPKPSPGWANPLLLPLDTPPFYVATIVLSDIGTKGGLKTDEHARVLRPDGGPIPGLYATGNTMAAMSGHVYPGAGTPIGSSLAFAYRAVLDIVGATED